MAAKDRATTLLGDLNGGLVAGLLSLPPAMALGALVFGTLGREYLAFGVVSGLISMAVANLVAGALGSVRVMTVGPSTPAALMLAAALSLATQADAVAKSGNPAATAIALVLLVVAFGGLLEVGLGALRLGDLAKFIPFPVVAGQLNGLAFLLIIAQVRPLFGLRGDAAFFAWSTWSACQPLTLAVGMVTITAIVSSRRISPRLPGALVGIVAGTAFFHLLRALGHAASLGPTIGAIPSSFPLPRFALPMWGALGDPTLRATIVALIPTAFGVAALLALGTLLSTLVVDKHTGERSNSSRELMAQGAANLIAACFGGNSVVGFSGVPIANYETGGRTRRSRLVVGLFGLAVLVVLGPLMGQIPTVVFAGTLFTIGISMVDTWSFSLLPKLLSRQERTAAVMLDLAIVVLVAGILVGVSILHGVATGVALSFVLFVVRMSRKTVRRRFSGATVRANAGRSAEELELLAQNGGRIQVLELEGSLFFGAADRLGVQLEAILDTDCATIVLDLERVTDIDSTGAMALGQIVSRAAAKNCGLVFSSVGKDHAFTRVARPSGMLDAVGDDHCFATLDDALCWAEDRLLDDLVGADRYERELPPARTDVLERLDAADLEQFMTYCYARPFDEGELVFAEGDDGDSILFISSGRIDLFKGDADDETRIMTLCPGQVCGEMAIIDGGSRSATARASGRLACHVLTAQQLERMRQEDPQLAARFYRGLSQLLSARLRLANRLSMELRA